MSRTKFRSAGSSLNKYLSQLRRDGFELTIRRSGHWHIRWGGRLVATCASSPSADGTAKTRNDVARGMARLGLAPDGKPLEEKP